MSCKMHLESQNLNNSGPLASAVEIRTTNLSRRLSSSNQLPSLLATSGSNDGRLNSSHADYNADSAIITMKTRVAVRDKMPHRFQVVPLRDVSKFAALEAGRSSQLALPLASHTLLRSASIRRQSFSQVRPIIASSYSQVHLNTKDSYNVIMPADSESLATPCTETLAMPILTLSPSPELDKLGESNALVQQDMNRHCAKPTTHKFESSITTSTNALQSYDASRHIYVQNPVADRNPSAHTTSQSSDLALCSSWTYPKIPQGKAPEHLFATIQSFLDLKLPRKRRTRSENIPSIPDHSRRESRNNPAIAVTKESCDSRVTKRHAIYTQSLYVPFLESPSYFSASSMKSRKEHQFLGIHPNDGHRTHRPETVSFRRMSQAFVSDSGTTLSSSDNQSSPATRRVLQDVEVVAVPEQLLQVLKAPSATAPHTSTGPHCSLNYHQRVYPFSAEVRLDGKIIYPQIVRDMFTDIDRAIHEWRHI